MDLRIVAIALVALSAPVAGLAQTPVTNAEAGRAADDDRVICKKHKATGTRFEKKTCMTARQWDAMREQNMRDAKDMIDRPEIEIRRGG